MLCSAVTVATLPPNQPAAKLPRTSSASVDTQSKPMKLKNTKEAPLNMPAQSKEQQRLVVQAKLVIQVGNR
jgi:hypothetical protein